jgi:hypothetical protein
LFVVTVIASVVAPVLHRNVAPVAPVAVNVEEPQMFSTATFGAAGIDLGAAVALADGLLVQPFSVCVTV